MFVVALLDFIANKSPAYLEQELTLNQSRARYNLMNISQLSRKKVGMHDGRKGMFEDICHAHIYYRRKTLLAN